MKSAGWKRWEVALAVGLAVGTVGLEVHGRSQRRQIWQAESAPLQAAMAAYRVEYGSLVRYGQQAPDFTARDAKGRPYHLADLLRGARYGAPAFLGGLPGGGSAAAGDLWGLERRFGRKGLHAAVLLESPAGALRPRCRLMIYCARAGLRPSVRPVLSHCSAIHRRFLSISARLKYNTLAPKQGHSKVLRGGEEVEGAPEVGSVGS